MGFSISAASAIIGVAVVMIIEVSVGTVIPVFTDLNDSYNDMRQRSFDELQTDIVIQNITVQTHASLHDILISVSNSGSTVIETKYIDVLVNGTLTSFTCADNYWFPEGTYTISLTNLTGSGNKKVKVVTENGISDYDTYSV